MRNRNISLALLMSMPYLAFAANPELNPGPLDKARVSYEIEVLITKTGDGANKPTIVYESTHTHRQGEPVLTSSTHAHTYTSAVNKTPDGKTHTVLSSEELGTYEYMKPIQAEAGKIELDYDIQHKYIDGTHDQLIAGEWTPMPDFAKVLWQARQLVTPGQPVEIPNHGNRQFTLILKAKEVEPSPDHSH